MVDYLIVGAGFAGATCAERLASNGKTVLIVEKRNHIGGNSYDYYDEAGILVSRYGAHVFHTNSAKVVDYLSQFTEWRPYEHRVLSSVNGQLLPVPINTTTLAAFGGDEAAARLAMVQPYSRKQWGPHAEQLSATVLARIKTRDNDDGRYFTDTFQQMPAHGYARLIERMLDHPKIKVLTNTSYREVVDACRDFGEYYSDVDHRPTDLQALHGTDVVYTGPIDEFFDYRFGRLPYRSARFEFATYDFDRFQPVGVVNYPSEDVAFTRIAEFKHLTGQRHTQTTIAREYPTGAGEPYWPVPTPASAALYAQYKQLADNTTGVHFAGRLGTFAYYDIHQVVAQALTLTTKLITQNGDKRAESY